MRDEPSRSHGLHHAMPDGGGACLGRTTGWRSASALASSNGRSTPFSATLAVFGENNAAYRRNGTEYG
jgi:hypothetical protein